VGVFGAAQAGTTFYGGTVWAADSARWESLSNQHWTFDSGVGSNFNHNPANGGTNPNVDPNKDTSLHAEMEGWIGFDNTFSEITLFRRLTDSDPRWGAEVCVGSGHFQAPGVLSGSASMWCGAFPSEADAFCFASGQGYGNAWKICVGKDVAYDGTATATLSFNYAVDTEAGFDFLVVKIDTSGVGDDVELTSLTGTASGTAVLSLAEADGELPPNAGTVIVKFCLDADAFWSDSDGLAPSVCGAFAIDDIILGGGLAAGGSTDFESSDDGWVLQPAEPGIGGEWSNIMHLSDLKETAAGCVCVLQDSVIVFNDLSLGDGHSPDVDNQAASPWIDLGPDGFNDQGPGKFINANFYTEMPILNYMFGWYRVQWYPTVCPATGKLITSPWTDNGFVVYFGEVPRCTQFQERGNIEDPMQREFSGFMDPGAEQVRISVGVFSYCTAPFATDCNNASNSTPWHDNVSLGVYGNANAPVLTAKTVDVPQDNFPENGTLNANAAGRIDSNGVLGEAQPEEGSSLSDTLVVQGGTGGATVFVEFAVRPGPGVNPAVFNPWLASHTFEGSYNGQDW
jgi:hypothetical protein